MNHDVKRIKSIVFSLLLIGQSAAFAFPIDRVVVFGDSLSDIGNLYQYMNAQIPMSPPYYQGRFSDGPVWVELVTEDLSKYNPHIHMENYAFGGASVLQEDDFAPGAYLSLRSQVDAFIETHALFDNQETLYIILMGANDYIDLDDNQVISEHIDNVISEINDQASRLAKRGAKFILIGNLPDLGRSPLAQELDSEQVLSEITAEHNVKIKHKIEHLKVEYPDARWIFFDINHFFTDAFYHPDKYNFKYTKTPCYGLGEDENLAGVDPVLSFASHPRFLKIKAHNCDSYLFFDIVHPTRRGHAFTASLALTAIKEAIGMCVRCASGDSGMTDSI